MKKNYVRYIIYAIIYAEGGDEAREVWGMFIGAMVSTYYINMSIFLAYAATYPEQKLMLYFLIPVKIKWFGYIYGAYILFDIVHSFSTLPTPIAIINLVIIVVSLLNFIIYLFFVKNKLRFQPKQIKRRHEYRQTVRQSQPKQYSDGARHKCCVCGRTDVDFPELSFRYCSKCSGNKEYCQDHLFTHEHR